MIQMDDSIQLFEFGYGDILIAAGTLKDTGVPTVSFIQQEPGEVGRYIDTSSKRKDIDLDVRARMIFTRIESIDLIIEQLDIAKDIFLQRFPDRVVKGYSDFFSEEKCLKEFEAYYIQTHDFNDDDLEFLNGRYLVSHIHSLWVAWKEGWAKGRVQNTPNGLTLEFESNEELEEWLGWYIDGGGGEGQTEFYTDTDKSDYWKDLDKGHKRINHLYMIKSKEEE